jgi:C-terminal processing protease CtpA/Prc
VLAVTLQDAGIAHVIGTRTEGAGHPARSFPLERGGGMRIATSHLKAGPNGRVVEGAGVMLDEVLRLDLEGIRNGRDNQLERALDYLHSPVAALE